MRFSRFSPTLCVLPLLVTLLLAGCGGGDDANDSESASPTTAAPTAQPPSPTADEPLATATITDSASPAGTGTSGSGSGSGTGGSAPQPTGGAASPTATERPRNVSTTPRPIATRPPQPTIELEQPTPTAESGSDLVVVYEDNFDDGDAGGLYVGTTDTGASAGVADGAYVASAPPGFWQSFSIEGTEAVTNGVMWATVSLNGTGGAAGLVARQYNTDDGGYWLLVCWIDMDGSAGCNEVRSNEFTNILSAPAGTIALQPANILVLSLADGGLYFEVNDQEVGVATVSDLTPGNWGVYIETYEGAENTAYFDDMTVWDAGP